MEEFSGLHGVGYGDKSKSETTSRTIVAMCIREARRLGVHICLVLRRVIHKRR